MARHGRLRADGAHAAGERLRAVRAAVLLHQQRRRRRAGAGQERKQAGRRHDIEGARALRHRRHRAGRRLHQRGVPQAARGRLEGPLDRRRLGAAHEGRRGHHPRPGEHAGDQERAGQGRQELDRRQLHRELHADGRGRAVQGRPRRVDEHDDLPGRIGRRRAAHARAAGAVRHAERRGAGRCSTTRRARSSRSIARCRRASGR